MAADEKSEKPKKISRRNFVVGVGAGVVVAAVAGAGAESLLKKTTTVTTTSTVTGPTTTVTGPTTTVTAIPPLAYTQEVTLNVNGNDYQLMVDNRQSLRDAIRNQIGLTGTKDGCSGMGECGACTVLADGKPILSCLTLAVEAQTMKITTIEGLEDPTTGNLGTMQQAFWANDGLQCGYCTPGMIMLATGILAETPKPTASQVMDLMDGNLCRCGSHNNIVSSVLAAAGGSS